MKKISKILLAFVLMLVVMVSLAFTTSANSSSTVKLTAPVATITDLGDYNYEIKWDAVPNADFYRVYKKHNAEWDLSEVTKETYCSASYWDTIAIRAGRYENGSAVLADTYTIVHIGTYENKITVYKPSVVVTRTTDSIKLSWDSQDNADGYRIYQYVSGSWKKLADTTKTTYTIKNLKIGTKYTFAVRAGRKENGKVVLADTYEKVYTATKTNAPTNVKSKQSKTAIKLTWDACEGASGYGIYQMYLNGTWSFLTTVTDTELIDDFCLSGGTRKSYAIRPFITTDSGRQWSDYTVFNAATIPDNPEVIAFSAVKGTISLTWKRVAWGAKYQLYYKKGNGSYKLYNTFDSFQFLNFTGLNPGTVYTFAVRAYLETSSGNVYSGYTPVSVTVVNDNIITNESASAIWEQAMLVYDATYSDGGFTDSITTYTINSDKYFRITKNGIRTKAEMIKYLGNFFDERISEKATSRLIEYEGYLYWDIGYYGREAEKISSFDVKNCNGNTAKFVITYSCGNQKYTIEQNMKLVNGKWIFIDNFYSPISYVIV